MLQFRKILYEDAEWQNRFFQFVASVFGSPGSDLWQLWRDRGGWTKDYEVFALTDAEQIISTIGRTHMRLCVHGGMQNAYQLGAVGTLPSHRRQGLARRLIDRIIKDLETPEQPILLFANNSVMDFYPRFGFRRVSQQQSTANVSIIKPFGLSARPFDPASGNDRSRLADLCAHAKPVGGPLSAQNYYPIALWHLSCRPITSFWVPQHDALIAATAQNGKLVIHDVIAPHRFDLQPLIPQLVSQPITKLEFCFNPEGWWPEAEYSEFDDADSPLFIRGPIAERLGRVQCPELAHT